MKALSIKQPWASYPSIWAEKHEDFMGEFIRGPIWNWVLANPVLYEKPILKVKGKLSFWETEYTHCEKCFNVVHYNEITVKSEIMICNNCK